ncbi:MAG: cobalamin biosynthesis protein CobQ [Desulfobulbaceae bacterium]|nr:MAG: cobalamin biosynthesis protein CobQ [Desulfobulbaceae bacterium]
MPTEINRQLPPEILAAYHAKPFAVPLIGVTGGKGGVGKTTVAVNLACALADMGLRVALADADVDGPNAALLLGLPLENPRDVCMSIPLVEAAKCTSCGACVKACRLNALFLPKGKAPILLGACNGCQACFLVCEPQALHRGHKTIGTTSITRRPQLSLYSGELMPSQEESALVVQEVKHLLFQEAEKYDILVVDTSPGAHCDVIKALQGADLVITVTEPTPLASHDFELILQLLDIFALKGVAFLNRSNLPSSQKKIRQIARQHHIPFAAEMKMDDHLVASYVAGRPLVTMFPEETAAKTFVRLARDLTREYLS